MTFTPRLSQVLESTIDARLRELHTSLPAQVVEYDPGKNQVAVQPQLKRKYINEDNPHDLPIINNVPVVFLRSQAGHLTLPLAAGDFGLIVFCERSIDLWQNAGRSIDPADARKFDLNDAVFLPGLSPQTLPIDRNAPNDSVELSKGKSFFEINNAGKFKIKNEAAELFTELVDLLEQLVMGFNELGSVHQTNTIFGPQKPVNFAAYNTIKTKLDEVKSKIESLKGA